MKLLLLVALLQAPQDPPAPAVEPWTGSLAEGLAQVKRLSESGGTAEALALTEQLLVPTRSAKWREDATARPGWRRTAVETAGPLLAAFGVASLSDAERATIHHARGVLLAGSEDGQRLAAVEAFERARSLAGPGELRLDATYDAAWTWLAEGEAHRAKIPEISGAAPTPAAPAGPPGAEPPAPDPLFLARTAYLQARERFVDRLKLAASDADTRANLELTQRRLRELSEIEKKREEEKKKQEQEQKDQQKKDEQDPNQDEQSKDEEKKDSEKKPDEQPKPDEEKPDEQKPEDPKEDEQKPDEPEKDAEPKPAKEEQQLTREEVMRLLDILKSREEEGKKLLEQLRAAQRVRVKKDW
ncbi:MAG: hypothetical protein ACKVXR_07300 [Planctomycetota bacterium]